MAADIAYCRRSPNLHAVEAELATAMAGPSQQRPGGVGDEARSTLRQYVNSPAHCSPRAIGVGATHARHLFHCQYPAFNASSTFFRPGSVSMSSSCLIERDLTETAFLRAQWSRLYIGRSELTRCSRSLRIRGRNRQLARVQAGIASARAARSRAAPLPESFGEFCLRLPKSHRSCCARRSICA